MDFSKEFRKVRNVTLAHVSHERSSVSLSEFFTQYHAFVMMTFDNCVGFWGCRETNAFPELDGITDFCFIDKSRNDSQAARDAPRTTERQSQILGSIWNFF